MSTATIITCPNCNARLRLPVACRPGKRLHCPGCRHLFVLGLPGAAEAEESPVAGLGESQSTQPRPASISLAVRPTSTEDTSTQGRQGGAGRQVAAGPQPGASGGNFCCPFCRSTWAPRVTSKATGGAWVLFVLMLCGICTAPFCWLPLVVMREESRSCTACGVKLG
jgi:hypothetical protein